MNNLRKIVLFSLFLTAFNYSQATEQKSEQSQLTEKEQITQQENGKVEDTKAKDSGAENYQTFRHWQETQEKNLNEAIDNAVNQLDEKQKSDPVLMQETINKVLLAQLDNIKNSAEELNIQDVEVKALKDKTIEVLAIGAQMIVDGAKMEENPTPEAHKAFGELQTKLNQVAEEGQKLEKLLKEKYAPTQQ